MFSKILVANRGEAAVRIIRACKDMGIATVAVYSDADRDGLHVILADEAVCIGPAPVRDSYLNMNAILSAAELTGAEAIHPGYGLLSENAKFADMCGQCNITFIGPTPQVIAQMGDKDSARALAEVTGVPLASGTSIMETVADAELAATEIGFPLLIKATAGGGGRGIRLVQAADELAAAYASAQMEALAAFGDGSVYLERYLKPIKHVEMQILADTHGNVVCLGERDCSIQHRNQKLLEECPSPGITPELREAMEKSAIDLARACGYTNAGTVEFMVDRHGNYYFLEMNTRVQVEHPVTEMVTRIDIVKWQIRIAAAMALEFTQDDITMVGTAIECRINASDPTRGFMPSAGTVTLLHVPGGPGVRFDSYLHQGCAVPPHYDSMVGKLIVHASTRENAIRKMNAALCELVIDGIQTTAELHLDILEHPDFVDGSYTTDTLGQVLETFRKE